MVICGKNCTAICDFCTRAIHEQIEDPDTGKMTNGEFKGCLIHPEAKEKGCTYVCPDFYCFRAAPEAANK